VLANILPGLGIDEFLTRTDVSAGVTSNFLADALGSPVAVTDSAGTVQTEYNYEAFGRTTSTGATNTSSYQYTGRENDGTGLYYYRARYYHPGLQRFISEDPILQAGDPAVPFLLSSLIHNPLALHQYSYALNSPIRMKDPLGLTAEDECVQKAWNDMWYRCIIPIIVAGDLPFAAVVVACAALGPGAPACILTYGAIVEFPVMVGVSMCYIEYLKKVELCRCNR